ncbi:hypothetical protein BGZ65_005752 [Modicella reniformis]|uniref:AAA-ATPase-like domain-containing protein n=1 Tax=Modicella reniformis TaxID=1440133 RepID=A0A9P6M8J7_9FUNG|nr:hypothetical protein BGZ65_005752 [Modicella reniformis]
MHTSRFPRHANTLTLFCAVDGESNPFSVEVDPTKSFDVLKKTIKKERANFFSNIDADQLTLWKVSKKILSAATELSEVFKEGAPKKTLHIIVRLPQPGKRGRERKPETSQKFPKILGPTSISDTRISQTISEESTVGQSEQVLTLPRDLPSFLNWRAMAGTIFADKTPYIEALETWARSYRVVFLRPRRFGKSAFLNMLCAYYDLHNAGIFNDLFGPLFIGKNPTPSRNKPLVLKFELSSIDISRSFDEMVINFSKVINLVLKDFLTKYCEELGYPHVESTIDTSSASSSLQRVLGQSLFVGVDEYDAPANNSAFPGGKIGLGEEVLDKVQHIETFFNVNFFSILKQGCSDMSASNAGVVIDNNFKSEGFVANPEESTAVHSTTILKSISDVGEFSVSDLMDLIASGSIQSKIKTELWLFRYTQDWGKDRVLEAFLRTQDKISALQLQILEQNQLQRYMETIALGKAQGVLQRLRYFVFEARCLPVSVLDSIHDILIRASQIVSKDYPDLRERLETVADAMLGTDVLDADDTYVSRFNKDLHRRQEMH